MKTSHLLMLMITAACISVNGAQDCRADGCCVDLKAQRIFQTPPVGWMTWYAVKFDASEEVILRNARDFKEKFGGYTDEKPVLWVDWEWYHRKMFSHGGEGEDALHPHAAAYPHGLDGLCKMLRDEGFTPALWIAPMSEVTTNSLLKAHPEWILLEKRNWYGQLLLDPTAPGFYEGYLKPLMELYRSWGYNVFKWDVMANLYDALRQRADLFAKRGTTPAAAFHDMLHKGREYLGRENFMLYCHSMPHTCKVSEAAIGIFDSMRVGGDIFGWDAFKTEGIDNLLGYMPYQSERFWPDCDNLVLRGEFNTAAQARTRVSIYALLGLPITIGDPIASLDDERIGYLRKVMPVRPTWRERRKIPEKRIGDTLDLEVAFERSDGCWSVRSFSNLSTNSVREVGFSAPGCAVWDVWNRKLLSDGSQADVKATIAAGDTLLVRVTPLNPNGRTLVGLTRHLTQDPTVKCPPDDHENMVYYYSPKEGIKEERP